MTEDETVGWHHQLSGHEFEQAPGVGDGQEGLACCSPWSHRVRHHLVTEQQQLQGNLLHHPFLGPSHQHLLCKGGVFPMKTQS